MSIYFDVETIRKIIGERYYREEKQFTLEELSKYDGSKGNPAYVAVNGIVYDVSKQAAWGGGTHFGLMSGKDLTKQLQSCHNIEQILSKLPQIGILKSTRRE